MASIKQELSSFRVPSAAAIASILIVENHVLLAHDLQQMVTEAGDEAVGSAASFDDAIRIAEAKLPQIELVDYKLNGNRDGITVARRLRTLGVKTVYVTANADDVRLIDCTTEIVPKPFDKVDLLRAIERVIASAEREPRAVPMQAADQ